MKQRKKIRARARRQILAAIEKLYGHEDHIVRIGKLHAALGREFHFGNCRNSLDMALYLVGYNTERGADLLADMTENHVQELLSLARRING